MYNLRFLATFTLALAATAPAATIWDNSNATNAWSTAQNWDTNIEPVAAEDVIFPLGLGATITLSSGELAKTLSFLDNYTFSAGGLTLASASSITVGSGLAVTSNSPITAPGGLTKLGDGTMIFNASNTFANGLFINAGAVRATNTGALGA